MNTEIIHQNQPNELAPMGSSLTMSSREIAELTGKLHKNVTRDIEGMMLELGKDRLNFEHIYFDTMNRKQAEYLLPKRETLILVSGYSISLRARIIDRWQVLESQANAPKLPDFNNPAAAARAWADEVEQKQKLELAYEEAKPAVQFVEKYVDGSGLMGFRQVCKTLKAKENAFREFLLEKKIMYRLNGQLTAYSHHIDAERFTVKTGINGHNGHAFADTMFTPKGVNWIAGEWAKHQIQGEL